jgi:hypothetical protein
MEVCDAVRHRPALEKMAGYANTLKFLETVAVSKAPDRKMKYHEECDGFFLPMAQKGHRVP